MLSLMSTNLPWYIPCRILNFSLFLPGLRDTNIWSRVRQNTLRRKLGTGGKMVQLQLFNIRRASKNEAQRKSSSKSNLVFISNVLHFQTILEAILKRSNCLLDKSKHNHIRAILYACTCAMYVNLGPNESIIIFKVCHSAYYWVGYFQISKLT